MSAPGWAEERKILESWFDGVWSTSAPPIVTVTGLTLAFNATSKTVKLATGSWHKDIQPGSWVSFNAGTISTGNKGPFKVSAITKTVNLNDTLVLLDPGNVMTTQATVANATLNVGTPWYPLGQIEDTPPDAAPWIEMAFIGGQGSQIELGSPAIFRHVRMIQFLISVPIGTAQSGKAVARAIGDALDALWANQHFETLYGVIRCRVPDYKETGPRSGRFEAVLSIPFLRDEQRSIPPIVRL